MHFRVLFLISLSIFSTTAFSMQLLMGVHELKSKLDNSDAMANRVILDLRSAEDYQMGHIPNSINVPLSQFHRKKGDVDGFIQTPRYFQSLMEMAGIDNDDQIILYSDWSFLDSARAYWALDFYGHEDKKILDGGFQAWLESDFELSSKIPTVTPSNYIVKVQPDKMATKFQTFMATKSSDYVIIDARPENQFQGEKSLTAVKGHIPNSVNYPWYSLLENRSQIDDYSKLQQSVVFKDTDKLQQKLSEIPKDKKIIIYCNGGTEASILYVGLKQLGIQASVYDGSWFEWSVDLKLPIANSK